MSCTVQSYNVHQWRRQNFGGKGHSAKIIQRRLWKNFEEFILNSVKILKILLNFTEINIKNI